MIDTHCHLDLPIFDADRDAVIARAASAGVQGILVPAIRPATWTALLSLVRSQPLLRAALGIHPQIVPDLAASERVDTLVASITAARDVVVAVGECGLDGGTSDRDEQERLFRVHIRAARELRLPLVVHVLRAHEAAPRILREEHAQEVGGVLHSYSGGADLVPVYADLNFAFSFAGPVTYPNARRPIESARAIPPDRLLAETDAPDQSPHRGTRSEPAFLTNVIAGLATARQTTAADISALTTARLFGTWNPPLSLRNQ